jgi:hypothetical protein
MRALFTIEVGDDCTTVRTQAAAHGVPMEALDAAIDALRHERANVHKCPAQRARDSDGSGEAGETPLGGSTEGDSAGPQDIAHPSSGLPS